MHNRFFYLTIFVISICLSSCKKGEKEIFVLSAPAGSSYTQINKNGKTVIPNGRFISPTCKTIEVAPHNAVVYVGGGQENKIFIFDLATCAVKGFIDCNFSSVDFEYLNGYIGDIVLSKNGKTLYAVDQMNFRMIIIDTEKLKIKHNVPVGRYPFGITLSPDEKKAYVTNVSHVHYSFGSIFKTFWNILGIPHLNQYDAGATDLADIFADVPDITSYNALPADDRIFDPQKALDPFDENFNWKALEDSPLIDNPLDMLRESKELDKDRLENREKKERLENPQEQTITSLIKVTMRPQGESNPCCRNESPES